ncbi:MAG TPA: amidohydrolase family protein [Pseudonocardia sp.]|uniref:amidohydrolase family protein n=1 Tax=Pseudonocardia sp. TaxID=60912 RepID=UPI002F3F05FE
MDWVDELALVDQHCHSLVAGELDADGFAALLTEGPAPAPGADPFDSMLGLAVRRECAPLLDLPVHAPGADYLARRAELGGAEVAERMLRATGGAALLVDHGFQGENLLGLDELGRVAAAPVSEVLRLESVAEQVAARVVTGSLTVRDYPEALAAELAARTGQVVATKSILAYRYGFDVEPVRPSDAEVAVAADRWLGRGGEGAARLTDPVLLRHALWCGVALGLPVQLHTGFGDPDEDLHRANPVLLTAFCRATQHTGTPIVLLHCYPYHREAAWLAQVFPHVHLDVGLAATYVGFRAVDLLAEVLELAPFGKLLYSSDAFGLPELYLVAARAFRRSVRVALGGWASSGEAAEPDVRRVAAMIAADNARRLYPNARV